jgi:RNA polymerase-binding transcription factor DksA
MEAYQDIREHLTVRLQHLERRLHRVEQNRRRATNALEPDWEEQASVRQNDEVLDELAEEERQQLLAIRAALQRLQNGTYGTCLTCGKTIATQRLVALPYASQCLACAAQAEQRR